MFELTDKTVEELEGRQAALERLEKLQKEVKDHEI